MKRPFLVGLCFLGSLLILCVAYLFKPKDPFCYKLNAKADLADDFCKGLAIRSATEKCQSITEDGESANQCVRVMLPSAHSVCMNYIGYDELKRNADSACE